MSAILLDGKALARELRQDIIARVKHFIAQNLYPPHLAVILIGQNPASEIYVRNKQRASKESGIKVTVYRLPDTVSEQEVLDLIQRLNEDPETHGILVQLPLPLEANRILLTVAPIKDVDGLHPYNLGLLFANRAFLAPCTPLGCLELIHTCRQNLSGLHAVVIGRSLLVGRPMAALLTNAQATVTLAHSHTRGLPGICQGADIVVAAMGKPGLVQGHWIKPGAIVIDVGISQTISEAGKKIIQGDVDFESVRKVAGYLTPVPGGVGPMTIAYLLANTLKAAEAQSN